MVKVSGMKDTTIQQQYYFVVIEIWVHVKESDLGGWEVSEGADKGLSSKHPCGNAEEETEAERGCKVKVWRISRWAKQQCRRIQKDT